MLDGGIEKDGDYSNENVIERYTKCLQKQIGSLVTRVCSKSFNVEEAIRTVHENPIDRTALEEYHRDYELLISSIRTQFTASMNSHDLSSALKVILTAVSETHKYLHTTQIWLPENEAMRSHVLYLSAEVVRIGGILMQPFMPESMKQVLDIMGVEDGKRGWEDAALGGDWGYGKGSSGNAGRVFDRLNFYE